MSIKWCRNCKSIGLRCANRLVPLGANLLAYVVQIAGAISVQIDNIYKNLIAIEQNRAYMLLMWCENSTL